MGKNRENPIEKRSATDVVAAFEILFLFSLQLFGND